MIVVVIPPEKGRNGREGLTMTGMTMTIAISSNNTGSISACWEECVCFVFVFVLCLFLFCICVCAGDAGWFLKGHDRSCYSPREG